MKLTIAMFLLACMVAHGEDFTTNDGVKHSGVVSRVEPDGIVITSDAGIEKIGFTRLKKEIRDRFGYDPLRAEKYIAAKRAADIEKERLRKIAAEREQKRLEFEALPEQVAKREARSLRAQMTKEATAVLDAGVGFLSSPSQQSLDDFNIAKIKGGQRLLNLIESEKSIIPRLPPGDVQAFEADCERIITSFSEGRDTLQCKINSLVASHKEEVERSESQNRATTIAMFLGANDNPKQGNFKRWQAMALPMIQGGMGDGEIFQRLQQRQMIEHQNVELVHLRRQIEEIDSKINH